MIKLLYIGIILVYCFSPFIRCLTSNIFKTIYYTIKDSFEYIYYKKWQNWTEYGITNFCGYFGKGKTLTATEKATRLYNKFQKYGKEVRIISNYELKDVPYIPLINFQQVVEIAEQSIRGEDKHYVGTILLIDEIENILSHRKFASFPMEIMHTLTQQRKSSLVCYATCQRFAHADKMWRDISNYVVECNKIWRFERLRYYDAWEVENAVNPNLCRPIKTQWYFVTNKIYNQYDTSSMITKNSAEDFISNDEVLSRRGVDLMSNIEGIKRPCKRIEKQRKMKVKK